jgi:perosamine synthetase
MTIPRRYAHIERGEIFRVLASSSREEGAGESIHKWEEAFALFTGKRHGIAASSGRLAMRLILKALKLREGSEIIIPAYTLKDLLPIIQSLGLKPIPADIDGTAFTITPAAIESRINENTGAIMVTHLFGNPCDMKGIEAVAGPRSIPVIEDCAHSAGTTLDGKPTGSFGASSFFSFDAIKPINTYGGGMVVTDSDDIAEAVRREVSSLGGKPASVLGKLGALCIERTLFATSLAAPLLSLLSSQRWKPHFTAFYRRFQHAPKELRYSDMQASLGLRKLGTLEERTSLRRQKAGLFASLIGDAVILQSAPPGGMPNHYFFVVLVPEPARRRIFLLSHGFDAGLEDEITDNCAPLLGYADCPAAEKVYRSALHIPLHEGMNDRQCERLAQLLRESLP